MASHCETSFMPKSRGEHSGYPKNLDQILRFFKNSSNFSPKKALHDNSGYTIFRVGFGFILITRCAFLNMGLQKHFLLTEKFCPCRSTSCQSFGSGSRGRGAGRWRWAAWASAGLPPGAGSGRQLAGKGNDGGCVVGRLELEAGRWRARGGCVAGRLRAPCEQRMRGWPPGTRGGRVEGWRWMCG